MPRFAFAGRARRRRCCRRGRRPPRSRSCASTGSAAAPPATTATSTTTATAATRRSTPEAYPQLAHVVYGPAARAADLDYGLADRLLFERPTLGNSSTAITAGALWRSLPRAALTEPDGTGPLRLWQNASREPALRLPGAPRLDPRERRPLPGQHPLPPGPPRLLGLGPAVPRGGWR